MMTIERPPALEDDAGSGIAGAPAERPWIELTATFDVEAWIDQYNWDLQRFMQGKNTTGFGVCFRLKHGGEVYLHTNQDAILLDVTPEAEWVVPVIAAATGVAAANSQIWVLPNNRLTQLMLGLSSLIATTRMVESHRFKAN
jgi:hypothetical protein